MSYICSRFVLICLLVSALLAPSTAAAQAPVGTQFANADWFSRPLGDGVTWYYYHFEDLFDGPQTIAYIEADMDTPGVRAELPFRNGTLKTTSMIKADYPNAVAGMNGGFFRWNGTGSYLRSKGAEQNIVDTWSNWGYQGGFVFNNATNDYRVMQRPVNSGGASNAVNNWRTLASQFPNMMVNGPLLMRNGSITSGQYSNLGTHCNRHPRSMVGMKPGNVLMLVVADGRHPGFAAGLTCDEMAKVMQALGCRDAVSLDGGGSTLLYGKGEPFNGILNYPSDNGGWDHDPADERSVGNAIAIMANPPVPLDYDARITISSRPSTLQSGASQAVSFDLLNIGTETWKDQRISITTSRPYGKASEFYDPSVWENPSTVWVLPSNTEIAPGQSYRAWFQIKGPTVPGTGNFSEYFQLTLDGATRIGPADDATQLSVKITPSEDNFMVESRSGGKNHAWYSESGVWANTGVNCTAVGATPGVGMRYGSTYRSVAGTKIAHYRPKFPKHGFYRVHVAWGSANSRRSPIQYTVKHKGGTETFRLSQAALSNEWVQLGNQTFEFDAGNAAGEGVSVSNESIDASGNMYAGPVWFEYIGDSSVDGWELY